MWLMSLSATFCSYSGFSNSSSLTSDCRFRGLPRFLLSFPCFSIFLLFSWQLCEPFPCSILRSTSFTSPFLRARGMSSLATPKSLFSYIFTYDFSSLLCYLL
jgi:hypothetical protein